MKFTSVLTQGTKDANGIEYEFTEGRAIVLTGEGDLLLSTGRWEDTIPGYGQILRYQGNGNWLVEATPAYQCIASMQTICHSALGIDQTLAGVWGTNKTVVLIRNNATKIWTETDIAGVPGVGGAQIRSFSAHSSNGKYMVFAGQTPAGVLSGVYGVDGTITWNPIPELQSVGGYRVMAFATLNSVLYCAMGETVYKRNDTTAAWKAVGTNPNPGVTNPGLGGLRGLIASPYNDGTLWMWNCSSGPAGTNALLSLNPLTGAWITLFAWGGGGIQAYNKINFINNQIFIGGQRATADILSGTLPSLTETTVPQLGVYSPVAVRTICQDGSGNIFAAGYDCDIKPAHRTGWVYQITL